MDLPLDRRQALIAALGALGSSVVLAACGSGDGGGDAAPTTGADDGAGASTTTTAGVGRRGGAGDLAARFDQASSCQLTAELTDGPFYLDVDAIRADIREDREGQTLRVGIRVLDRACQPVPDAVVEIWHCDATGIYSGFEAASAGGGPGGGAAQIDDTRYLRGGQVTDARGIVQFTTVYPGWYRGRTAHIHSKVHLSNREALTTQLFFDEAVTDEVYRQEPYASDAGRDTSNATDSIFDADLVLTTTKEDDGYLGLITYVVA